MNDTTVTPEELPASTPAVSEQPDPVKELEAVRTGTVSVHAEDYARDLAFQQQVGRVSGCGFWPEPFRHSVVFGHEGQWRLQGPEFYGSAGQYPPATDV